MECYFIISTTHWDREWYRTFNDFRIRLCDVVNELLRILDTNLDFRCFTFDGQVIALEDYLEIYPENEVKIRNYIKEGMVRIIYILNRMSVTGSMRLGKQFLT